MSGHSKWATIKHKKAATDAKRGKMFTKIGRMIVIAVREGGSGDPNSNPTLRTAMDKAREANMPNDNVRRAIERGLGKGDGGKLEEVVYEGYGPGGVGVIVKTVTDNRNRTGSEIRNMFDKSGGSIGAPGSVAYLKSISPVPMIPLEGADAKKFDDLMEELDDHDDVVEVWNNRAND